MVVAAPPLTVYHTLTLVLVRSASDEPFHAVAVHDTVPLQSTDAAISEWWADATWAPTKNVTKEARMAPTSISPRRLT